MAFEQCDDYCVVVHILKDDLISEEKMSLF